MIKVFGHISPDTDATVSAILWAWYLNTYKAQKAEAFVLGSLNKETSFVLHKWNIPEPTLLDRDLTKDDQVVIVDTNNPKELPDTIGEADIIQIIDHHMLVGGLSSRKPIPVTIEPVASTATVMFDLMNSHVGSERAGGEIDLPTDIAGLLLSSILSDTLAFRSPTTTPKDKSVADSLAKKLGLDIETYANEMFAAKSDISDFTDKGLLHLDSKKFELGDKSVRVSVIETTNPETVLARKDTIVQAIEEIKQEESDITDILFFVVDILKEEATVFTYNQFTKDVITHSFGVAVDGDTHILPGVVSRKKQIIPSLKL